uniref:Uncharacterized protein n=1 Tax=Arundo donax TaxID=35708 RepID=A0A0A8ZIP1_ARUDO
MHKSISNKYRHYCLLILLDSFQLKCTLQKQINHILLSFI